MVFLQRFCSIPLRWLLVSVFIGQILGSVGLVGYLSFKNGQQAVEDLGEQLIREVTQQVEIELEAYLTTPHVINHLNIAALQTGLITVDDPEVLQQHLWNQLQAFELVSFIYVSTPDGGIVATGRNKHGQFIIERTDNYPQAGNLVVYSADQQGHRGQILQTVPNLDARDRPWFRQPVKTKTPVWSAPFNYRGRESIIAISASQPLYDLAGQLQGVATVDFNIAHISDFLKRLAIIPQGQVFILDRTGTLIATSSECSNTCLTNGKTQLLKATESSDALIRHVTHSLEQKFGGLSQIQQIQRQRIKLTLADQPHYVQVNPWQDEFGLDWLIVVTVPESAFMAQIQANNQVTIVLCLVAASLSAGLAFWMANRLSTPILQLSQASHGLSTASRQNFSGDYLDPALKNSGIREIKTLAISFEEMSHQLEASYLQLEDYSRSLETKVQERTQALAQESRNRQQSETRFQTLVSNLPGAVYRCKNDEHWTMIFISEAITDLCGYSASEFIENRSNAVSDILCQDDTDFVKTSVAEALRNRSPFMMTYRITHKDGSIRWVYDQGQGNFPAEGEARWIDGVMFDITAQKQAEAAMQHRAEIDNLLSHISRTFMDADLDTAIEFALQRLGEFTQSDRSYIFRFYEQDQFGLTHEYCAPNIQPALNDLQRIDASTYLWFYQKLHSDQPVAIANVADLPPEAAAEKAEFQRQSIQSLLNVPMIYADNAVGFIGLDRVHVPKTWSQEDINLLKLVGEMIAISQTRHAAEIALKQAKEAAEIANKTKSEFLANMSHELRSPLNAILGFAQLVARSSTLAREHRDNVNIISRSGEHLLDLINDVLDMSKIEAGLTLLNPADFDLYRLLDDLKALFLLRAADKHLQLEFFRASDVPQYIHTDPGKLRQVLINVLGNAVKFTVEGRVMLRVRLKPPDSSWVSGGPPGQRSASRSLMLHFEVEDTGPGIAADEVDAVFEPFVQSKAGRDSQQGTGLGLPISRRFVQLMGGDMVLSRRAVAATIASGSRNGCDMSSGGQYAPSQGTLVSFDIQVEGGEAPPCKQHQPVRRILMLAPNQPRYQLLIVDDKPDNRQLLLQFLQPLGFEIREASNGQEAVEIWQDWQPQLIWMDIHMPVMDGFEATRQIRYQSDLNPQIASPKIIAISASSLNEEQLAAKAAGCDDFIQKPLREARIFEMLAQQIGVRYVYEDEGDENQQVPEQQVSSRMLQDCRALGEISPQLLDDLESATLRLQWNRLLQLIEEIRQQDADLANALSQRLYNFQYAQILHSIHVARAAL